MDLNPIFARLLSEGNSLRGISRILGLTYYNTYKKFLWLKTQVEVQKNRSPFPQLKFSLMNWKLSITQSVSRLI
jgi:hypothetical protein